MVEAFLYALDLKIFLATFFSYSARSALTYDNMKKQIKAIFDKCAESEISDVNNVKKVSSNDNNITNNVIDNSDDIDLEINIEQLNNVINIEQPNVDIPIEQSNADVSQNTETDTVDAYNRLLQNQQQTDLDESSKHSVNSLPKVSERVRFVDPDKRSVLLKVCMIVLYSSGVKMISFKVFCVVM